MHYTIQNDHISVGVSSDGGTLTSIVDLATGAQLLWQGDPRSWMGRDIAIFPVIAMLRDDAYEHCGQRYRMHKHGLVRYSHLNVIDQTSPHSLTLVLDSSQRTRQQYPFDFRFEATFRLNQRSLCVCYRVKNTSDQPMPYFLGGHPALALDATETPTMTDTSGNWVLFDQPETPTYYEYVGIHPATTAVLATTDRIELAKSTFVRHPTLILRDLVSRGVTLVRRNGTRIRVDYGNTPVLALWSDVKFGAYVCVEPWSGVPDLHDGPRELGAMTDVLHLQPAQSDSLCYTLTLLGSDK